MKNRVIVFLISVIMTAVFVSLTAVGVFAQDKLAVSVSSEQVKEDAETVTLDVSIKNNPGIAGVTLSLEFDNTALAVKSVTEGEFSQLSLVPGSGNQSPYKVMLVNFLGASVFSVIGYYYVKNRGKGRFARRFIPQVVDTPQTEDSLLEESQGELQTEAVKTEAVKIEAEKAEKERKQEDIQDE